MKNIYRVNDFAVQIIASGSFEDADPGFNGKTYIVETVTVRLNHIAMNEWIFAQAYNDRQCYDSEDEYKEYLDEQEKRKAVFIQKIAKELGYETDGIHVNVTQIVSEIFGVVYIHEKK